jgi:hypothetical protein
VVERLPPARYAAPENLNPDSSRSTEYSPETLTRFQSPPLGTRRSHSFRISLAVLLGSGTAGEAMTTRVGVSPPPEIYLSVDVCATGRTVCLLPRANLGSE